MDRKALQQICVLLMRLHQRHGETLSGLLSSEPFLEGSVVLFKRKCGKAVCRCQKGPPHESLVVSRRVGGKLKVVYARDEDKDQLLAIRNRYRKFKQKKKELHHLQRKIMEKLDRYARLKTEPYRPS